MSIKVYCRRKRRKKITVSEPYSSSSSSYSNEYRNVTYTSSNVFFFQDLLEFLKYNSLMDIEKARDDKDIVKKKEKKKFHLNLLYPIIHFHHIMVKMHG